MKKLLALGLMAVMSIGTIGTTTVSADEAVPVPVLINEEVSETKAYTIKQDGEMFSVIVSENGSTGYTWGYEIADTELVEFISEELAENDTDMVGAPSDKTYQFKVLKDGVTTITFKYARSFESTEPAEEFRLLAYKNGDTIIIEEDGIVEAYDEMDTVEAIAYEVGKQVFYDGKAVEADVDVQVIDGVTMVPLRATLEAMGYTVTWKYETQSVEISKGAQWTSIKLGENAYFKNRMAAKPLSAAPLAVDQRTLVPVEFFGEIIGHGIMVDNQVITVDEYEVSIHSGYVKSITIDETGAKTITLTSDMSSDDIMFQTIIHTSAAFTIFQKEVAEGDMVSVITSQVMTMSIPGQTSGYVVY